MKIRIIIILYILSFCIVTIAQDNVSPAASYNMTRRINNIPSYSPTTHTITQQVQEHVNTQIIAKQKEWTGNISVSEHKDTIRTAFVQTEVEIPNVDIKTIILFDKAKDILRPEFKNILDIFIPNYINLLRQHKVKFISFRGFASTEGTYEFNMDLSQRRANAVLKYCQNILSATDWNWLKQTATVQGFGATSPIIDENGLEDYVHSRRVEIDVVIEE